MPTAKQLRELAAARSRVKLTEVPPLPAEPEQSTPAAEPAAKRTRTPRVVTPMPDQQPRQPRKERAPAAPADKPETFPHRVTLTTSYEQADDLDTIRVAENRRLREAGHEQVYTTTGLIRAAVDVCLSDPKLRARMIKAAGEPRLSGRGGIGTRR